MKQFSYDNILKCGHFFVMNILSNKHFGYTNKEQDADYSIMVTYCLHKGTQITFIIAISADAYGFCAFQEAIIHINKHTVIVCLVFRVHLFMSGKCLQKSTWNCPLRNLI